MLSLCFLCFLQQVKAIAETGCRVVVSGGKFGELALHFLNKYNIMAVRLGDTLCLNKECAHRFGCHRVLTKFDLRRVCKATGTTAHPTMVSVLKGVWFQVGVFSVDALL